MSLVLGVLALQGDVREHQHALAAADVQTRPVRRVADLTGLDGLVIPGGESTTMSKLAIEFGLLEPLQELVAAGLPVYGSCAGMIMLATEVLDGRPDQRSLNGIDMTVRRNAFGRQVDSFEAKVELAGVAGGPFHAVFIRAPWVERVGPDVEVLGSVPDGELASRPLSTDGELASRPLSTDGELASRPSETDGELASRPSETDGELARRPSASGGTAAGRIVAVRQHNLLATAFHPELTGDLRVHRFFVDMVRSAIQGARDAKG